MRKKHLNESIKIKAVEKYLNTGTSYENLSEYYGVVKSTIGEWVREYKRRKKLNRKSNPLSGRQPKILEVDFKKIKDIVKQPASNFGYETDFWTTKRLQQILKKELKLKVSRMAIFRTLKKLKLSYHKPESRYYHKNKKVNTKNWVTITIPEILRTLKKHNGILYFEDEASVSLTPSIAKTWGPIGKKIIREVSPNRGSISIISAISKNGNLLFNIHDKNKRYNSDDIISFLSQMLKHHPRRHLVVVMDQAPCHKSKKVKAYIESQSRLHVFYLPPRTPEFNPDEGTWDYLKNIALKEHKAKSTQDLKKLSKKKLIQMAKNKKLIKGIFEYSEGSQFFA